MDLDKDEINIKNEQTLNATKKIKDETREVGSRILKKLDETLYMARATNDTLDNQTIQMKTINNTLDNVDVQIKESKTLVKHFNNWWNIFRKKTTLKTKQFEYSEHPQNELKKVNKQNIKQNYEIKSDDPADEIADKMSIMLDELQIEANKFTSSLGIQANEISKIDDGIEKSNSEISNVSREVKYY